VLCHTGPIIGTPELIVAQKSGTSMAAPIVGGTALLVRQYFQEGWFPTGSRRAVDAHAPAASLVKAVLIHASTQRDADSPMNHGFGSLDRLSSTLYFGVGSLPLLVRAPGLGARSLETAAEQRECVVVDGAAGASLKVMLTWTDPAAAAMSGVSLVNDLDLVIYGPPPYGYSPVTTSLQHRRARSWDRGAYLRMHRSRGLCARAIVRGGLQRPVAREHAVSGRRHGQAEHGRAGQPSWPALPCPALPCPALPCRVLCAFACLPAPGGRAAAGNFSRIASHAKCGGRCRHQ
jgi:hypothetical protein